MDSASKGREVGSAELLLAEQQSGEDGENSGMRSAGHSERRRLPQKAAPGLNDSSKNFRIEGTPLPTIDTSSRNPSNIYCGSETAVPRNPESGAIPLLTNGSRDYPTQVATCLALRTMMVRVLQAVHAPSGFNQPVNILGHYRLACQDNSDISIDFPPAAASFPP